MTEPPIRPEPYEIPEGFEDAIGLDCDLIKIKPMVLPGDPVRWAMTETLWGLKIPPIDPNDTSPTSFANLRWMVEQLQADINKYPLDKAGRWIGFIQGVLAARGLLDVDAERDRTRPFFKEAYKEAGIEIPETKSMGDSDAD